jgi:hypothetical protein
MSNRNDLKGLIEFLSHDGWRFRHYQVCRHIRTCVRPSERSMNSAC